MKIHFNPKDILPKLRLAKAVTVRSPVPILQNVKIVADKQSGAVLHATDLAIGIRIRFKCKVMEDGTALLPVKRLITILGSTKASQITLASTDGGIVLEADGEEYTFLTQPPDEFPDVSDFTAESYHKILAFSMQAMIQRTVFVTDKEAERNALSGVCFESERRIISAVATDGRQLAWHEAMGETVGEPKIDRVIVPAKTLTLLDKILKDKSLKRVDKVKMAAGVNDDRQTTGTVLFQCGDFTLFSRLCEGRFPKWRSIIPKADDMICATVNCGELRTAVNNVKGVITNLAPGVYLTFEKGRLTLIGEGKEVGKTKKAIPLTYTGRKMMFKIDESFLTALLKVLDVKTTLSVYLPTDGGDPILIRCADGYHYVVMPMSYKDEDLPAECRDVVESACETVESELDVADNVESENEANIVPIVESESEVEVESDGKESEPEVPQIESDKTAESKPVKVMASKPPTAPTAPPSRPVNSGKSAVVQRESGESVAGTILAGNTQGCIVFAEQASGKLYRIPSHCCTRRKSEGVIFVSISEVNLSANAHLLGMFTLQSLF